MAKRNQGEIWIAKLYPTRGAEVGKTRPVLIIQGQDLLELDYETTLVMPLTSQIRKDSYPIRIPFKARGKLKDASDIMVDQVKSLDNSRFTEGPIAVLTHKEITAVLEALSLVLHPTYSD